MCRYFHISKARRNGQVIPTLGSFETKVKFTKYFESMRGRPDRLSIRLEWIEEVVENPDRELVQADGRIRRWGKVHEAGGKYLRVILLADGETIHNAFFDRTYTP